MAETTPPQPQHPSSAHFVSDAYAQPQSPWQRPPAPPPSRGQPLSYGPPPTYGLPQTQTQTAGPFHTSTAYTAYLPPQSQQYPPHHQAPQPSYQHQQVRTPTCSDPDIQTLPQPANAFVLNSKRRSPRALLACQNCRLIKTKCDETHPCKNCRMRNSECNYITDPQKPHHQTDQKVVEIMSQMSKQLTERFATVERAVLQGAAVAPRTGDGLDSASATVAVSHVPPPDLPFRCTTRAARMLSWPAIQAFVPPLFQVEGVSDLLEYPLCLEEHRGTASVTGDLPEWSGADSRLDFDPDKVWRYVHSYEMNIQNMHPLIPPLELYALVTAFLEALPAKTNPKRKRSSEPQGMPSPPWSGSGPASNNPSQAWPPSCSIQQALVLNILALGKICLHKQEAHTPSIELAGVDAGSDYFAAACSILGTLGGGRELTHVWALLLGGLYYGQLVQPIQSLEMVVQASRRLQIMLRPGMHHYMQLRNGGNTQQSRPQWQKRDNQCIVAFWTCVQLESDILETLPLPPSGILAYEQFMPPYPNGAVALEQGFGEGVLQSYTAQLFLRNQLNNFSTYAALDDDGDKGSDSSMRQLNAFSDTFQVHSWAPPLFLFRDGDPPAMDVLGARLRAKYWDAQAAMHQPFIQRILSFDGTAALAPNGLQQARRGIQAFIESTRAFHALPASAIITTNPFGLAHMQWVNLLVLDAVERDLVLGCYAPADLVDALFLRTIDVLDRLAPPSSSSALACDLRILKELHRSRLARSLCRTVGEQDFSV